MRTTVAYGVMYGCTLAAALGLCGCSPSAPSSAPANQTYIPPSSAAVAASSAPPSSEGVQITPPSSSAPANGAPGGYAPPGQSGPTHSSTDGERG